MSTPIEQSARAIARDIAAGRVKATEVCEAFLARIREEEPRIGAFNTVIHERAMEQARAVDAARHGRRGRPAAARRAGRDQGQHVHGRRADHRLVARAARVRAALFGDRGLPPRSRRRDRRRQDQPRRVRDGIVDRELVDRPDPQSVGHHPHAGRQQRRIRRRGGREDGAGLARLGHRWFHSPARGLLRARRPEADLRARVALWAPRVCLVARSDRPVRPHRRRRRAGAAGDRRPRCARRHVVRRARPRLRGGGRSRRVGTAHRRAARVRRRRRGRRRAAGVCRLAGSLARGRRADRGHRTAACPARHSGLLPDCHGRGLVQSGALRRRPLRPSRDAREGRWLAGDVRPHPGRGLRPRGEAPHHARHLRAERRLLRRLLPEGAAGAHPAPPGLRARLCRVRRGGDADHARRPRSSWARRPTIRCRCT